VAAPATAPASAAAPVSPAESDRASEHAAAKHIAAAPVGRDEAFGAVGQIVPLGSVELSYITGGGGSSYINIRPGVLYFIMDNLAVGGKISIRHTGVTGSSSTQAGLEPLAAYNLVLADKLTFFPQAGIVFDHAFGDLSGTVVALDAFAPVLYHVASHFFVGAGPEFDFDLIVPSGGDHSVTIGLVTTIGGYFSL
jgi:hypothetical protein